MSVSKCACVFVFMFAYGVQREKANGYRINEYDNGKKLAALTATKVQKGASTFNQYPYSFYSVTPKFIRKKLQSFPTSAVIGHRRCFYTRLYIRSGYNISILYLQNGNFGRIVNLASHFICFLLSYDHHLTSINLLIFALGVRGLGRQAPGNTHRLTYFVSLKSFADSQYFTSLSTRAASAVSPSPFAQL